MEAKIIFLTIYFILETVAMILIVCGNLVVVYVMIFKKKLIKPSHSFILSVAIADLLMGLVVIPLGILTTTKVIPNDYYSCVTVTASVIAVFAFSLTTLPMISIDRLWAICFPIHYRNYNTRRINVIIICISWLFGVLLACLAVSGISSKDSYRSPCNLSHVITSRGTLIISSISSVICFSMITIYIFIFREISRMAKIAETQHSTSSLKRSEVKSAKIFSMIIGSYIICWAPLTIQCLIIGFTEDAKFFDRDLGLVITRVICICAAHYNSAINPFIYAYQIRDVRNTIKNLLHLKVVDNFPVSKASETHELQLSL